MSITDMSVTREQRRQLMRDNAKQPEILTPVPESEWPPCELRNRPTDVWRSRHYLVQAYSSTGGVTRLSIDRTTMQALQILGGASRSRTDLHGFAIREAEYAPP